MHKILRDQGLMSAQSTQTAISADSQLMRLYHVGSGEGSSAAHEGDQSEAGASVVTRTGSSGALPTVRTCGIRCAAAAQHADVAKR